MVDAARVCIRQPDLSVACERRAQAPSAAHVVPVRLRLQSMDDNPSRRWLTMSTPLNMDLRARAELLTYLVVSHLLARHMTGDWLSVEHVVESTPQTGFSLGGSTGNLPVVPQ